MTEDDYRAKLFDEQQRLVAAQIERMTDEALRDSRLEDRGDRHLRFLSRIELADWIKTITIFVWFVVWVIR